MAEAPSREEQLAKALAWRKATLGASGAWGGGASGDWAPPMQQSFMQGLTEGPVHRDPRYDYGSILPFRKPKAGGSLEWATPDLAAGLMDTVSSFRRGAEGRAGEGDALLAGTNLLGTNAAVGPKLGPGELGNFGGARSRTANLRNLSKAIEMEGKGAKRGEIRDVTEWARGEDTKWGYELPNRELADLTPAAKRVIPQLLESVKKGSPSNYLKDVALSKVWYDPALEAAYPEVFKNPHTGKDTRISIEAAPRLGDGASASTYPTMGSEIGVRTGSVRALGSVIPHELGHHIQGHEGWSSGGSAPYFRKLEPLLSGSRARDIYNRLVGEVQSRNIQYRMENLRTEAQRKATHPWESQLLMQDPVAGRDQLLAEIVSDKLRSLSTQREQRQQQQVDEFLKWVGGGSSGKNPGWTP